MRTEPPRTAPRPFHPMLLAAYLVLFLYGQNLGELSPGDLIAPLVVTVSAAIVAVVIGSVVLRDARRAALIATALVALSLGYGHVNRLVAPVGLGPGLQQVGWAVLAVITLVMALRLSNAKTSDLTRTLNLVTAVLVAIALFTIVPAEVSRLGARTSASASVGGSGGPGRDIYFLVFDRYGSARSLDLMYGIDEEPFLERLRARGFEIVSGSHANYVKTSLSLAATLNLDYLDAVAAAQGPDSDDHGPVFARLADHAVGRFLVDRGYEYVHVGSTYGPTRTSPLATRNLWLGGPSDFAAALYDESAIPAALRRLGVSRATPARERQYEVGRFQLDTLDGLADDPGPKFVFAHLLLPHPPYVFASDGSFVSDGADAGRTRPQGYAEQLAYLQTRIDALVDRLLARPERERPIIILQADEGPYPTRYARDTVRFDWSTATADELEIKFGILNAMYLPGDGPSSIRPDLTSVNTFRMIFDAYFGSDLPLLPDRSFTSAGKFRPYDLTEITDRLPNG